VAVQIVTYNDDDSREVETLDIVDLSPREHMEAQVEVVLVAGVEQVNSEDSKEQRDTNRKRQRANSQEPGPPRKQIRLFGYNISRSSK
jgi:hypothetical protein